MRKQTLLLLLAIMGVELNEFLLKVSLEEPGKFPKLPSGQQVFGARFEHRAP
jgi:hypothetical protein